MSEPRDVYLVYDSECPICDLHSRKLRLADGHGRLVLVDARKDSDIMDELTSKGIDIDAGIAVKIGDTLYDDLDAVHELTLRGDRRGLYNRLFARLFGSRRVAAILYPPLKACRRLLLRMLGRTPINNLGLPDRERF